MVLSCLIEFFAVESYKASAEVGEMGIVGRVHGVESERVVFGSGLASVAE